MTREYFLEDPLHPRGGITIKCKDETDCVFCKHCTDIWWDYSNLIYMLRCELDKDGEAWENEEHTCEKFEEGMDE